MTTVIRDEGYASPADCRKALESMMNSALYAAGRLGSDYRLATDDSLHQEVAVEAVRSGDVMLTAHGWQTVEHVEVHEQPPRSYVEILALDSWRVSLGLPVVVLLHPTDEQRDRFGGPF